MEGIDGAKGPVSSGTRVAQVAFSGVAIGVAIAALVGVPYIDQLAGNPMFSNVVRFGPTALALTGGALWGLKAVKSQQRELTQRQLLNLRSTQLTASGLRILPVTKPKIAQDPPITRETELPEPKPNPDDQNKKFEPEKQATDQQSLFPAQVQEILNSPQNLVNKILEEDGLVGKDQGDGDDEPSLSRDEGDSIHID